MQNKPSILRPVLMSVVLILIMVIFMFGWVGLLALGGGADDWYEYLPLLAGGFSVIYVLVLPTLYLTNIPKNKLDVAYLLPIALIPGSIAMVFFFARF